MCFTPKAMLPDHSQLVDVLSDLQIQHVEFEDLDAAALDWLSQDGMTAGLLPTLRKVSIRIHNPSPEGDYALNTVRHVLKQ